MTGATGVSLRGIVKRFGAIEVIKRLDLDIAEGEFVVIVGPSGCGKSTLLRIIAGLEEASEGAVSIKGRDVTAVEPKDRDIAMVFQSYALYPHMTVNDNMSYGLRTRRVASERIAELVGSTGRLLQIEHLLARRPRQLSGGQRQRVAMGRAMVRQPHVYLFDEPLSNLDAKLRSEMRVELRRLHEQFGVTSVYVTHDQVEAMTLADRLVIMNSGTIEQIGRPIDLYLKPRTMYVAGFIGAPAMNFLKASVSEDGTSVRLAGGHVARLPRPLPADWAGRAVMLGIRPEHLALAAGEGDAHLAAEIELIERLGADTVLHCRMDQQAFLARLSGVATQEFGAAAQLIYDPDNLHLFDPDSGIRIDAAENNPLN